MVNRELARETGAVVRYGHTFYVVVNVPARKRVVTQEWTIANAIASFPFDGPATKTNTQATQAMADANARLREWHKAGERT